MSDVDVDDVLRAAVSCATVAGLSDPSVGDAVLEPGWTTLAFDDHELHLTVIAYTGIAVSQVADELEQALRPLIGDRHLVITIDDLVEP